MILTINGGSSSIKFALYQTIPTLKRVHFGQINGIGSSDTKFIVDNINLPCNANDLPSAVSCLVTWINENTSTSKINAIGHRIVHGMQQIKTCLITNDLLKELKSIIPYDPDHLPTEIKLIEAFKLHYPQIKQFACFDTAFHQTIPRIAQLLPIPRRFEKQGIRKYGFHGLSYQYLIKELEHLAGKKTAHGRVVLAHLGNGASLAAVYKGKSMDTSMGFTPAGGIPMSTRSGDIDPGVAWIIIKTEKLSPRQFDQVINHQSGLLGISGTNGDMSVLLSQEDEDIHSAEAVDHFCYQVRKWIGAFAAALGGIDTLVFSGGIGEHSAAIRARICGELAFLGIELNNRENIKNSLLISKNKGRVPVYVIPTNEELMIAELVSNMIDI
jgi:acetate kinase